MWRAFFLGIGLYLMIAGAECLAVDRVILANAAGARTDDEHFSETGASEAEGFSARPVGPVEPLIHRGRGLPVLLYHSGADGRKSEWRARWCLTRT